LEAGSLLEGIEEWAKAINLYRRLEKLIPPLRATLENKILKISSKNGLRSS